MSDLEKGRERPGSTGLPVGSPVLPPAVIGVAGVGVMGASIVRHLVSAGYRVLAYDVRDEAVDAAVSQGALGCGSLAELSANAGVVITSLPSAEALDVVARGLRHSQGSLQVLIDASTLAVEEKQSAQQCLAEAGIRLLDCPLSGTGAQMRNRDVVVYASGEPEDLARCRPVMEAYARAVVSVGRFGDGSRVKLVANLLVAVHNVAAAEALALCLHLGLDPHFVLDVLTDGAGNSKMLQVRGPMMANRVYQPATMRVELFQKDLRLIGALARQYEARTPLLDAASSVYAQALAEGHADDDTASVLEVLLSEPR